MKSKTSDSRRQVFRFLIEALDTHAKAVQELSEDLHDLLQISGKSFGDHAGPVTQGVGMLALLVALKAACDTQSADFPLREVFAELLAAA